MATVSATLDKRTRAKKIRDFLWGKNLRQKDVAEKYGLTQSAVTAFVCGYRVNNLDVVSVFTTLGFRERRRSDGSLIGGPKMRKRNK